MVFNLASPSSAPGCLLIDTSGIWLRPEGKVLSAALLMRTTTPTLPCWSPEYDAFEDHIWPTLAERIPGFGHWACRAPGRATTR